jgi:hypothetical protein
MRRTDELWLHRDGLIRIPLHLRKGQPIGAARLGAHRRSGYPGGELGGLLRSAGSLLVPFRYPLLVEPYELRRICRSLSTYCARSNYYDPAWIVARGEVLDSDGACLRECRVILLTREQLKSLAVAPRSERCRLNNNQVLRTVDVSREDAVDRKWTVELQQLKFLPAAADHALIADELLLQAMPSAPFADKLTSQYSYYCVLNPVHRQRYGYGFLLVRNEQLERDYLGFKARLAIQSAFDDRVRPDAVGLDWTTSLAIGLRPGELVGVSPLPVAHADFRRRVFRFRHCLCRAVGATVLDMEQPIARLPSSVFDVLGLQGGNKVVLEGSSVIEEKERLSKITLRALEDREGHERWTIATAVPSFTDIVGLPDLPFVAIDLEARMRLGITPGSPLYVRPAFSSVIVAEFTSISLVLLAAIFSAAALQSLGLALILIAVYLTVTTLILVQRFR